MANIKIDIASEFTGAGAFRRAGKESTKLEKTVGKLGAAMAAAFSARAIYNFGKDAAKAFMEDEKSAKRLTTVVDNLGLSFAQSNITEFIAGLQKTSAVADDDLRPAFQALLSTTGHVLTSQELLKNAIDISAGSGVDLATVANDLAQAFVGNTKGLKKYNIGLSQSELKTKSFAEIQQLLNSQFTGSNAAYLETYSGKMQAFNTAAGEAKETIGEGLVTALMELTNSNNIDDLTTAMEGFAESTSNVLVGLGKVGGWFTSMGDQFSGGGPAWWKGIFGSQILQMFPGAVQSLGTLGEREQNKKLQNPSYTMALGDFSNFQVNNQKKIEKNNKQQNKNLKDQAKLLKQQTLEKKQQALFDIQHANIIAALKGNITAEERKRLELQLALLDGNSEEAAKLSNELALAQDKTGKLAAYIKTLPDAKNPFAAWGGYLDAIELQAKRIAAFGTGGAGAPSTNTPNAPLPPMDQVLAKASSDFAAANQTIKLLVEGGDEVTSLMRFKIQEAAQSGSTVNWSQSVGAYDR